MISGSVNLTSAMRTNLISLQGKQNLIGATQNRLATGLKVSSAVDDPRNFFQARALNARASDLGRRLDGMGLAIKTIEAADKGIKAIIRIAENMAALTTSAADSSSAFERSSLLTQYNALRTQMENVAKDSGFNGINLLNGNNLTVKFNESGSSSLSLIVADKEFINELGLLPSGENWDNANLATGLSAIQSSAANVNAVIMYVRNEAVKMHAQLTTIRVREEFTKDLIGALKAGADGLVLADQNEEAANLIALQTRRQLGIEALSLAAPAQQDILRLFG